MRKAKNITIAPETTIRQALEAIDRGAMQIALVVGADNQFLGTVTDGDIRRGLSKGVDFLQRPVTELMTAKPKTITKDKLAAEALHLMESHRPKPITVLPVLDAEKHVIGLLHMTDLVRQGVV